MPEKDDFDSWEPEDMEEDQQQPVAVEQELRQHMSDQEPEKPSARRRTFLLLLLMLVMAGAAAFVYLGGSPEPEAPQAAPPLRKPIALPPPPVSSEEATVKTETIPPAPPAADKPQAAVSSEPPAKPVQPMTSTPEMGQRAELPVKTEAASLPTSGEPATEPAKKATSASTGPYFLQAGAFLIKDNLRAAEATVRRLGYEPQVKTVRRSMPMTRLRVGGFFAEEGEAKLAAIKPLAPDAFLIRQGDYVLVYAGAYQNIDRARRAADQLYQEGIRVEEEPTTAEVSLSLLSFGAFADRGAAEQAASKARAAGLEALVRKDP